MSVCLLPWLLPIVIAQADAPPPAADVPTPEELADEIDALAVQQRELEKAQRTDAATRAEVSRLRWLPRFINVFIDVGAFAAGGDGSGIRTDIGHVYYPSYMHQIAGQWVFMGDPLSTSINSLGEPADTSTSREIATDTVNSSGRPALIVNAIGLSIGKDVGHGVALASLAQLLPRPGGTLVDVQLAQIDFRPLDARDFRLSVGKIDSVLGIEYRAQDAPVRLGVTPSLICRYTCGRPFGISARLTELAWSVSASLTNGDNFQDIFEHDAQLESNRAPTAAAHVQRILPIGQGLEVGASGAIGPQDNQPSLALVQWHIGVDLKLRDLAKFDVSAEYVQGRQPGRDDGDVMCGTAQCLTYKGAYVLVDRRIRPWLTPYVRVDWRDAVHIRGTEFVYESHTLRASIGGHFEMTRRIIGKIEYTWNHELDRIPQFADDVVTSSLVVTTD
jgi:hypothetical protein